MGPSHNSGCSPRLEVLRTDGRCGRRPQCSNSCHIYRVTNFMQQGKVGPLAPRTCWTVRRAGFDFAFLSLTGWFRQLCLLLYSEAPFSIRKGTEAKYLLAFSPLQVAKRLIFIAGKRWSPHTLLDCLHEARMGI